jgi:hypothetical protein
MKKLTTSLMAILVTLVILSLILPMKASADHGWAVGEWKLSQSYHDTTFSGTLSIQREDGRFSGRIYFDTVGHWEHLKHVEVTDETLSFSRPMAKQKFRGHRHGDEITGHWDSSTQGEWKWRAWRD